MFLLRKRAAGHADPLGVLGMLLWRAGYAAVACWVCCCGVLGMLLWRAGYAAVACWVCWGCIASLHWFALTHSSSQWDRTTHDDMSLIFKITSVYPIPFIVCHWMGKCFFCCFFVSWRIEKPYRMADPFDPGWKLSAVSTPWLTHTMLKRVMHTTLMWKYIFSQFLSIQKYKLLEPMTWRSWQKELLHYQFPHGNMQYQLILELKISGHVCD